MKSILKNRKGFTLIELLAVIVILAILVMVAIPAVTRYLNYSRQATFADNAKSAISAARNFVIINGNGQDAIFSLDEINGWLERKLITSPFGAPYSEGSYVRVHINEDGTGTYYMCLTDTGKHGFTETPETEIDETDVQLSEVTECTNPSS